MTALILSLLLSTSSSASWWGDTLKIRAKDYSCAQIQSLVYSHGRVAVKFGIFTSVFYASSRSCNSFEKPESRYFKAKGGEPCRAMACVYDHSRNR
jgi:hypothetical protein